MHWDIRIKAGPKKYLILRGRAAILQEKKHKIIEKKRPFLTQILNINEYFSDDYCEIFLI